MTGETRIRDRHLDVRSIGLHVRELPADGKPALVLLHGWPESVDAFDRVMQALHGAVHAVAIGLPGVGKSHGAPSSADKRTLAGYIHDAIGALGLRDATLAGHDVGGMVAYAYLRAYPGELRKAAIMNTAIPGVDPWTEVARNPHIWHFAFHAVPELPELLVAGHQAAYFDFFYDALAADPRGVDAEAREAYAAAYARIESLQAGFDWYRAFAQDEKDNQSVHGQAVETPVLYLRGARESGKAEDYARGLAEAGLRDVQCELIPECGHFSMNEKPRLVAESLLKFLNIGR